MKNRNDKIWSQPYYLLITFHQLQTFVLSMFEGENYEQQLNQAAFRKHR